MKCHIGRNLVPVFYKFAVRVTFCILVELIYCHEAILIDVDFVEKVCDYGVFGVIDRVGEA